MTERGNWWSAPNRPGGGLLVTVGDSGPGIAAEDRERIFESFYTTKAGGVGIGLSICRSIIDAHGRAAVGRSTSASRRRLQIHTAGATKPKFSAPNNQAFALILCFGQSPSNLMFGLWPRVFG